MDYSNLKNKEELKNKESPKYVRNIKNRYKKL